MCSFAFTTLRATICTTMMVYVLVFVPGCAPPEEPASLQKGSGSLTSSRGGAASGEIGTGLGKFNYGGAALGDAATQSEVKKCVAQGLFYERRQKPTPGCTTFKLAEVTCTDDGVKNHMNQGQKDAYLKMLSNSDPSTGLSGFVVDQCLDCPSADANALCAATTGNPERKPGFLLFMLKDSGSGALYSKTVFFAKP